MCGFGVRVPAIPWTLIAWSWLDVAIWMLILGSVRIIYDRFASDRTARHLESVAVVNQSLHAYLGTADNR